MERQLGPLKLDLLVNSDTSSYYRFFYRRNDNGDNIYTIRLDDVIMNRVNLHERVFNELYSVKNYLNTIAANTQNVSESNLNTMRSQLNIFLSSPDYSCVEIILPVIEGNDYSQEDINQIYKTATQALGI